MDDSEWGSRYAALMESTGDAILVSDFDSALFIAANPAACRALGYNQEELMSLCGRLLHPPAERDKIDAVSHALRTVGKAYCPQLCCVRKDGSRFWVELRSTGYREGGRKLFVTVLRDISERVARERDLEEAHVSLQRAHQQLRQSSKLAAIGELAAGVAHEVNNPAAYLRLNLTAAQAHLARARTMVGGEVDAVLEEVNDALAEGSDGLDRIVDIVSALRSLTAPDHDLGTRVNIDSVVDRACSVAENQVRQRARLVKTLEADTELDGLEGRLVQVFVNLLLNAAEALDEGGPEKHEVTITTKRIASGILVSVRDTGPGIAPSVRERLFDPFVTTKRGKGQGLGLALCADIVRRHQGNISVRADLSDGTCFDVELPLDTGIEIAPTDSVSTPPAPLEGLRLLVVDDERMLLKAYRRALGPQVDLTTATGVNEALVHLRDGEPFDLILCDLMMPNLDGVDFYLHVERHHAEWLDRVVFCTGGAFTERTEAFIRRADITCLAKPVDLDEVRRLARR